MDRMRRQLVGRDFVSLCYHYIRPEKRDPYPRLLGTRKDDFRRQVRMLKRFFRVVAPVELEHDSGGGRAMGDERCGLLFTFDDGLSDHLRAAEVLAEEGVSGLFFIPTCILADGLPANPVIIHYGVAIHRLDSFLDAFRNALEENGLAVARYDVPFRAGESDPWTAIRALKHRTKYDLGYENARRVLLSIYRELLCAEHPTVFSEMHLDISGVKKMLAMGHNIGAHSHTHLSVAASTLSPASFHDEVLRPRNLLQDYFDVEVVSMSYPFGGLTDCLTEAELRPSDSGYRFAFTVERKLNTAWTSPFALGRYMPMSTDSATTIRQTLEKMVLAEGAAI